MSCLRWTPHSPIPRETMKGYKERVISMVTEEHSWGVGDGPIAQHTVGLQLTSEERIWIVFPKNHTNHAPSYEHICVHVICVSVLLTHITCIAGKFASVIQCPMLFLHFFFQTGCSHLLIKIEKVLEKKSQIMVFYVHSPDRALNTWLPFSK